MIFNLSGFLAIKIYRLTHPLYLQQILSLAPCDGEWAHIASQELISIPVQNWMSVFLIMARCCKWWNNGDWKICKDLSGCNPGRISGEETEEAKTKRHPTIEDNVTIYANSTILGGDTVVGHDSVIGGNTWQHQFGITTQYCVYKSETIVSDGKILPSLSISSFDFNFINMKANNIDKPLATRHVKINRLFRILLKYGASWKKSKSRRQHQRPYCTEHDWRCRSKGLLKKEALSLSPQQKQHRYWPGNGSRGERIPAHPEWCPKVWVLNAANSWVYIWCHVLNSHPVKKGWSGAIEKQTELLEATPNGWMPQQFDNPANIAVHAATTAQKSLPIFRKDWIIYYRCGYGRTYHRCGTWTEKNFLRWKYLQWSRNYLRYQRWCSFSHPIQGIGAGFIPTNLDTTILDGVIQVSKDDAFAYAQRAAKEEGIFQGISSGATMAAVAKNLAIFLPEAVYWFSTTIQVNAISVLKDCLMIFFHIKRAVALRRLFVNIERDQSPFRWTDIGMRTWCLLIRRMTDIY